MLIEGEAPDGPLLWFGFFDFSYFGDAIKNFPEGVCEVSGLFSGVERGREKAFGVLEKSLITGRSNPLELDPLSSDIGGLIGLLGVGAFE